ncbi:hypothetical protein BJX62DRAFT_237948 [Aspergillus germanicus]
MKSFATFATIIGAASMASAQTPAAHVLRLTPLSVKTLTESQTARIDFTVQDPTGGASTTCSTAWNVPVIPHYSLSAHPQHLTHFAQTGSSAPSPQPRGFPAPTATSLSTSPRASPISRSLSSLSRMLPPPPPAARVVTRAVLNSHVGTPVYVCRTPGETAGVQEECAITEGSDVIAEPVSGQ